MTEPSREQLLDEGRKQARIQGVDSSCAEVYAQGWAAAARRIAELEQQNYWLTRERDSAKAAVQPLVDANQMWHQRIAKVREICADHSDCDQAFGEVLAVLDGDEELPQADLRDVVDVSWQVPGFDDKETKP